MKVIKKRLNKPGRFAEMSGAQMKREIVTGELTLVSDYKWGKVVRLKRYESYYCFDCDFVHPHPRPPHPRRALIIIAGLKTPVRLRGKKWHN